MLLSRDFLSLDNFEQSKSKSSSDGKSRDETNRIEMPDLRKNNAFMQDYPTSFRNAFIEETKRRLFEECVPRLKKCLGELSEEQIWYRPNENSNSVGNITLHLCGNVRQWVIAGLGRQKDVRERQQEFDEQGPIPTDLLLKKIDDLMAEVAQVLVATQPEDLLTKRIVQNIYEETGLSILVHVVEHFSYHVGQVTYVVKMLKNMDTGYYAGENLG